MSKSARRRRRQARLKKQQTQPNAATQASAGPAEPTDGQRAAKAGRKRTDQPRMLRAAWRRQPIKLILAVLLSVAVALYVGWPVARQRGLGQAVMWGAVAGASVWIAFYASYRFNLWLRGR